MHKMPTLAELVREGSDMVLANENTGKALAVGAFFVIFKRNIYNRLYKELKEAFPEPDGDIDFKTLETLPYLTGVVKESLR